MTVTLTLTANDGAMATVALPAPTVGPPTLAQLLADKVSVWKYDFQRQGLSLRTGGYPQGPSAGYATGKGVWAAAGAAYMTDPHGYAGFGHDIFVNPNSPWYQATDPTFPPFGTIDPTIDGVKLMGFSGYPAIRNGLLWGQPGNPPFLASYLTAGYAANIKVPYARRVRFTITGGDYDFPGVWGYGKQEVGGGTNQNEIDDFERFCKDNPPGVSAQTTHIDGVSVGSRKDMGYSLFAPHVIETVVVHQADYIYFFTDGVLCLRVPATSPNNLTDTYHPILDMSVGASWEAYPTGSIGNPTLTVQSVEILAPTSNTTGVFPPTPPTPIITWGTAFAGGVLRMPPAGTVVATLSGAATYRLIPYLSTFTGLAVSGSSIVTVGTLAVGSYDFYIEGTDASGMPCLAAKQTATVTALPATQFVQSISTSHTNHCVNMDIVGNTLYLCAAWSGLGIYDITDRSNPVEVATITDTQSPTRLNALSGVKVAGNYAFVACEQSNGGSLTVVNLTTRTVVGFLNSWVPADPPGSGNVDQQAGACSIVLNAAATIAYISTITRHSLCVVDISTPTAPRMLSEARAFGTSFSMAGCRDVAINEAAGIAYVASEYTNNIAVVDISVPTSAHIIATVANAGNPVQRGLTLNAAKNRLYVVGSGHGNGGMDIWDVSNPRAPVFISAYYGSSSANFYGARGVVICGNYAYLCSEYGNCFLIVDITNETAPVFIAKEAGPTGSTLAEALWMRVQDGYAYLAQFGASNASVPPGNSLSVIKINPPYPTPAGR